MVLNTEQKLWKKVERYSFFMKYIPFVKAIYVCNNLSFLKVNENSDIDLFIVSKKNRLFLCRALITFVLSVLFVRRHGNAVKGRFCLSFFVDEKKEDLSFMALKNDYYLSFWVLNLKPIISNIENPDFILERNLWIKSFWPENEHFVLNKHHLRKRSSYVVPFIEFLFNNKLGDFLEKTLKEFQLKRALNKSKSSTTKSCLIINDEVLKFHENDRRAEYNNLWEKNFPNSKLNKNNFISIIS